LQSNLSKNIQAVLEKEIGPVGVFILQKQCEYLSISFGSIEKEHLPKLALQLSDTLLVFGREKANKVYIELKRLSDVSTAPSHAGLEQELDLAEAAWNVGNIIEEKGHLFRAESMGAASHPEFSGRFHCLRGSLLLNEGELENARREYDAALSFSQSKENPEGVAEATYGIGKLLWRAGKYSEARDSMMQCVDMNRKMNKTSKEGKCLMALSNIHDDWGRFDESISYSDMSKKAFDMAGDERGLATLHNNLGVAYARRNMFKESLAEYQQCIYLSNKIGYKMLEGWAMFNAAEDNARLENFQEALELCGKSDSIFMELGDKLGKSGVHMSYAVIYWLQGDSSKAEEHFSRTLDIRRSLGMPYRLADALYDYGRFLVDNSRLEDAKSAFAESRDIFKDLNNQERVEQLENAIQSLEA